MRGRGWQRRQGGAVRRESCATGLLGSCAQARRGLLLAAAHAGLLGPAGAVTHEDGAASLDLLELVDCGAGDVAVGVQEGGEVLQLLADDEAQRGKHGHAAVHQLALAPAAHVLDAGAAGEACARVQRARQSA